MRDPRDRSDTWKFCSYFREHSKYEATFNGHLIARLFLLRRDLFVGVVLEA